MTRLLKLAAIILSIISLVSAQIVETLNTPAGPFTKGAKVSITWTNVAGSDATGKTAELSATNSATKGVTIIDPAVPLAPQSYLWDVQVDAGNYFLGLNDGSGPKQSGEIEVKDPSGGAGGAADSPPAEPSTAAPAAPAPAAQVSGGSSSPSSSPAADAGSSTTTSSTSSTTGPTGSASSIFSGYDVVFSLLGVAIAMVQF